MYTLSEKHFLSWLDQLKRAWQSRDPRSAAALFSVCKYYLEDPFEKAATSSTDIRALWSDIARQSSIELSIEIICVAKLRGVARWHATFVMAARNYNLDGIYVVDFNRAGHCVSFMQWTTTG